MPENEAEPQETPNQEQNGQSTDEQLATITAQLEEERAARAQREAEVGERDARIQELETQVQQATAERDGLTTRVTELEDLATRAVTSYRNALQAANPAIPSDLITGNTIEDLDQALDRARNITEQVRKNLEAQIAGTRVPAGAPAQATPSLEGLTSRQLIERGITRR